MNRIVTLTVLAAALCAAGGCAAFRRSIDEKDPATAAPLTGKFDQRDLLAWGNLMASNVLADTFMSGLQAKPVLVSMGIQNRTSTHMDSQALADTITTRLFDSGKIRLVNAARRDDLLREQGYQVENCTPETQVKVGRQLGARYMMTGALVEIEARSGKEVRVARTQDVYYQLTVELTDLESGEIVIRKQADRLRRVSKPFIGW